MRFAIAERCANALTPTRCRSQAGTPRGDAQKRLQGLVGRNDLMIVLIGRDAKSCLNVTNEIELAKRTNVPYFGVLLGDADAHSLAGDARFDGHLALADFLAAPRIRLTDARRGAFESLVHVGIERLPRRPEAAPL